MKNLPALITVKRAATDFFDGSEQVVRRLIFNGDLDDAVVRIGRRVWLRTDRLFEIVEAHTGAEPWDTPWRDKLGRPPKAAA